MGQSKYTVTLDKEGIVEGIENASNSERVSRKEFVEQAVTDYLLAGPRTKRLQEERAELREKCDELLKDRKRLYGRNDELAEERDKVAEQNKKLEGKVAELADQLESLIEEVKTAQDAGFFGSGKAVRSINLAVYSCKEKGVDEPTTL